LPRAATAEQLKDKLLAAGIVPSSEPGTEKSVQAFSSPAEAFANAMSRAGENDRIAVFGSFFTVAGVMATQKRAG
jgi:dihydrofolate synthase/folylpolyglutamate synthase